MTDIEALEAKVRRLEMQAERAQEHAAELFDRLLALQVGVSRVLVPLLVRDGAFDMAEWDRVVADLASKQEHEARGASPDQASRLVRVGAMVRELALAPGLSAAHRPHDSMMQRRDG